MVSATFHTVLELQVLVSVNLEGSRALRSSLIFPGVESSPGQLSEDAPSSTRGFQECACVCYILSLVFSLVHIWCHLTWSGQEIRLVSCS